MKTRCVQYRLIAGALLLGTLAGWMAPAGALSQVQSERIEGVSYNVDASLPDNLKALSGKKVYVTLRSGKTFTGTVGSVSTAFVHLEQLEGKEYFDALIRVDDISAIDVRFRAPKR